MATWIEDIVSALTTLGGSGTYDQIYEEVARHRSDLPRTWKDGVRRFVQTHSSDSAGYTGGKDLFFSVNGLGQGVWGLRAFVKATPVAADLPPGTDVPGRDAAWTYRVLRDTKLVQAITLLHRDQCQICGAALQIAPTVTYSEGHHIIPLGAEHKGPDVAWNIIVLCPNHHALCDMGAIPLDRTMIRAVPGHDIADKAVDYHNTVILGSRAAGA